MLLSKHFTVMRASRDILKKKKKKNQELIEVSGSFQDNMVFTSLPDGGKLEAVLKPIVMIILIVHGIPRCETHFKAPCWHSPASFPTQKGCWLRRATQP